MKIKAEGQTRHRFWGEYSANIILLFSSMDEALLAQPILNQGIDFCDYMNACGGQSLSEGWRHIKDSQGEASKCLFIEVADPALEITLERLKMYGADRSKIMSMAHSIDHGEIFHIEVEVEDPLQTKLNLS